MFWECISYLQLCNKQCTPKFNGLKQQFLSSHRNCNQGIILGVQQISSLSGEISVPQYIHMVWLHFNSSWTVARRTSVTQLLSVPHHVSLSIGQLTAMAVCFIRASKRRQKQGRVSCNLILALEFHHFCYILYGRGKSLRSSPHSRGSCYARGRDHWKLCLKLPPQGVKYQLTVLG